MLRYMESQRVGHNWATELNWTDTGVSLFFVFVCFTLGLYAGLLNIQEEWENYDINEAVVLVAWILCLLTLSLKDLFFMKLGKANIYK